MDAKQTMQRFQTGMGLKNKHVLLFLLLRTKTNNTKNMFYFVEGKKKYFKKCVFERTNLGKKH